MAIGFMTLSDIAGARVSVVPARPVLSPEIVRKALHPFERSLANAKDIEDLGEVAAARRRWVWVRAAWLALNRSIHARSWARDILR